MKAQKRKANNEGQQQKGQPPAKKQNTGASQQQ
jgi:hypothetical protein